MRRARKALERFRTERTNAVRQYVGMHYSEDGTRKEVPVNLLSSYVSVVGRNLIAKNPRVMLSTFERQHRPTVAAMQKWVNGEVERMRLADTLQRVVIDGLFSIGICKVALATPAESASVAWSLSAGEPFAERVDLDDFVFDIHARDFNEAGFIGHRYRVPLDVVKDSRFYSASRKKLEASADSPYNLDGDERISVIGRGAAAASSEDFEDMVDLWEVYLPRHRLVLTLADDNLSGGLDGNSEPLRVQNWVGPDQGPYHVLKFLTVPGNAMPKGPIQDLVDLHVAANRAYRKMIGMSERTKEVLAAGGGAANDAARVVSASDGDVIKVERIDDLKQVVFGGTAVQPVLQVATVLNNLFNRMGGNLELLGGMGPQSKTATQDKLLNENAGSGIADMQDRTLTFVSGVAKALCWYWHHDPVKVMRSKHPLAGAPEFEVARKVAPPQRRAVPFEELEIKVDPYSMRHQTPQERMGQLQQVFTGVILPLMPLLQQQGISIDLNAYLLKIAELLDMPDLVDVLTIVEPPGEGGVSAERPGMPAQTERKYVRESMPGRTQQGFDQQVIASGAGVNMGGNPDQPSTAG